MYLWKKEIKIKIRVFEWYNDIIKMLYGGYIFFSPSKFKEMTQWTSKVSYPCKKRENNEVVNLESSLTRQSREWAENTNSLNPDYTKMSMCFVLNLNYIKMLMPLALIFSCFWKFSKKR